MHEVAIAEGILAVVVDKSAGQTVKRVRVRVGSGHAVSAASLRQCFQLVAADTIAADAILEMVMEPGERLSVDGIELVSGRRLGPG